MSKDHCPAIRERLAAFLDDELPADASHDVQEHLESCSSCAELTKFEQAFTRAMRSRINRYQAPATIVERFHERLQDEGSAPGPVIEGRERKRRRLWSRLGSRHAGYGIAAAAILVLVVVSAVDRFVPRLFHGALHSPSSFEKIAGVLVCLECERHGLPLEIQKKCLAQAHQTGLRCPETGLWHLVANEASLPLLGSPEMRGRQVVLEARRLHDIRYLDVRAFSDPSGT